MRVLLVNPHSYVYFDSTDENGDVVNVRRTLQSGSLSGQYRLLVQDGADRDRQNRRGAACLLPLHRRHRILLGLAGMDAQQKQSGPQQIGLNLQVLAKGEQDDRHHQPHRQAAAWAAGRVAQG
jgi:hypothetical protein